MLDFDLNKDTIPKLWPKRQQIFKEKEISLSNRNIDSAGLGFLVTWSKSLGNGERLVVKNVPDEVKRLIFVFNIGEYFDLQPE